MNTDAQKSDLEHFSSAREHMSLSFSKISRWIIIAYFVGRDCDGLHVCMGLKIFRSALCLILPGLASFYTLYFYSKLELSIILIYIMQVIGSRHFID
jgi:hypothetical protein